ncbi:hypothetical protein M9Y10_027244 [Tritrichomonas musculus]|uniref:Serine/threonine-protein phosphatase n=1 Tax=Tritrichomonas musculus TaxID=1915356 RepID=A0ABR2H5V8_9EUKA
MLIYILLQFYSFSPQNSQYYNQQFSLSNDINLLGKNHCFLLGMNSTNDTVCHKNDYDNQEMYYYYYINSDLKCMKSEELKIDFKEQIQFEILKDNCEQFFKTLFYNLKSFIITFQIQIYAISILMIPIILVFLAKMNEKIDKSNRLNLPQFVDSIMHSKECINFSKSYVKWLCRKVQPLFLSEPSLLELESPVCICGDIHGQLCDLLHAFEKGGEPPKTTYLFLGDYVDRGEDSVDVICLLFGLKLLYPDNVYLLRGNHESPEINQVFGFADECERKLNYSLWHLFNDVFDTLPIGAVVGKQFFCVHGGLSPYLENLNDVKNIVRPCPVFNDALTSDLLWTDPNPKIEGWGPNPRGETKSWGHDVAECFLKQNNLKCIVRGHQMAFKGFNFPFGPFSNTVTVFTASKYGRNLNQAAIMLIDDQNEFSFIRW